MAGGTGFIGRVLCRQLVEKGYRVVVLSRGPGSGGIFQDNRINVVPWDARTPEGWKQYADGAYGIINLTGEQLSNREGFRENHEEKNEFLSKA
ncbi:MAG: NAD-dependent epimerase/dehydratase family protein [Proteobacteria bacterium]|nr:NAD-dependent epimerase/dehydratase family protein [Pseudomonadota bacterium]